MTISAIASFAVPNIQKIDEVEQWVLKGSTYINDNTDAKVTVKRHISGDISDIFAVEEWDSMAAYELGWQKLRKDPEWRAIFSEGSENISKIHVSFYSHLSP